MIAVQHRFGLRGKVVGYHGIQSFKTGEVTPEQAFEIGKATARKMWGDRYQVLVTVHLNTENAHCHFVVNPVSFKDGTKFQNKIGDHKELRRVSDEMCREHGLSVLENSSFYGGHKKDYWRHKSGKKTHRDYICLLYTSPSITSPSPGICSPAFTMTISPFLRVAEETAVICSFLSAEGILCASTSFFEARRASACAFPRPSAIASAKFAKIQVNHRIMAIAKV